MRYLVTYDISDDGVRGRVVQVLNRYGFRVQLSCFEIMCDEKELMNLLKKLKKEINPLTDSIYVFPITKNAEQAVCEIGLRRESNGKVV